MLILQQQQQYNMSANHFIFHSATVSWAFLYLQKPTLYTVVLQVAIFIVENSPLIYVDLTLFLDHIFNTEGLNFAAVKSNASQLPGNYIQNTWVLHLNICASLK